MTTEMTKAPHCPRCGGAPKPVKHWCDRCGFNGGDDALGSWPNAVRAELARQALEMRAHTFAREDGVCSLECAMSNALDDYNRLGTRPLRLPGEEA